MPKTSLSPEDATERALTRLVQRLREVGGENLLGVAVYGTAAKVRPPSGAAETNVLVVVGDASLSALLAIAPVLTSAQRQSQVASFVTTPAELGIEAQLFPARVLEMRLTHRLLHGNVHLEGLEIKARGLRFAALQEIKGLELRLRHRILDRGTDPDLLWASIVQSLPRLVAILETIVHARSRVVPAARGEMLRLAGEEIGIDPARLEEVNALRQRTSRPPDEAVREELSSYMILLRDLIHELGRVVAQEGLTPVVTSAAWTR